ncbi:hypothetical protein A6R68_21901, partial [Neotoma lepida]
MPPTHADLGKSPRDVFTKGYRSGLIKLDLEIKSENGLEFTSSGSANTVHTKVNCSLETKYSGPTHAVRHVTRYHPAAPGHARMPMVPRAGCLEIQYMSKI